MLTDAKTEREKLVAALTDAFKKRLDAMTKEEIKEARRVFEDMEAKLWVFDKLKGRV